jgi:hypothetical protein
MQCQKETAMYAMLGTDCMLQNCHRSHLQQQPGVACPSALLQLLRQLQHGPLYYVCCTALAHAVHCLTLSLQTQ